MNYFKISNQTLILFIGLQVLCFCLSGLQADTVILKNGQKIVGNIVNQSRTKIIIQPVSGKLRTLKKSAVRRVSFGPVPVTKKTEKKAIIKPVAKKSTPGSDQTSPSDSARISRTAVLWRAAVLPGWGHLHAGKSSYGIAIGGIFLASTGYTSYAFSEASTAEANYNANALNTFVITNLLTDDASAAVLGNILFNANDYEAFEASTEQANFAATITGIIYIAQLVHAYFMDLDSPHSSTQSAGWQWQMGLDAHDRQTGPPYSIFSNQNINMQSNLRMVWRF